MEIISIVSVLLGYNLGNCRFLLDLQDNKEALNTDMEELKHARDDVKRRVDEAENDLNELMKRTDKVNNWLQEVQTIQDEVCEIVEKADQEIQGWCLGGYCPKNCWSAYKIGKRVIQKRAIVNNLRSKENFGSVAYRLPPPLVQREHLDLPVGMESMFDKVGRWLADDKVRIMGLYGQGGVGKTTLLKLINNEFHKHNTAHGFDVVILVVVSKEINIHSIRKEIGDRLGLLSPNEKNIRNALSKKNFLLLLDDIWQRIDLQSIGIPPPENKKSKIVFTTRFETVCQLMEANEMLKVQCLPWHEAWSLFQEKVGERTLNSFPRARELAEVLARECGGLPLSLITIGRTMSTKKTLQEWKYAITTLQRSASEFPGMSEAVFPLLKKSYDNLSNDTIKSCFLYCALFTEDESINKSKLIDYWIGEGLISLSDFKHIDEARNYGYDVIGDLKGACLLESGENDESTNQVKIDDAIRDLALWITHECESSKRGKMLTIEMSDLTHERLWYNAERVYLTTSACINRDEDSETKVTPPISPTLLTLIFGVKSSSYPAGLVIPHNFFQFMSFLRVLDLSCSRIHIFPFSITKLLELQYLSLSGTYIEALPNEFGKLVKLKYLNLSLMMYLEKIPSGVIGSLLELRVLNLFDCSRAEYWDLEEFGVYSLKHMNDLEITIKTQHNLNKLLSNKDLQMCTRCLYLSSQPIKSLEKLKLLSSLETLYLDSLSEPMNMAQQHHRHLRDSFQNLSQIKISNCNELQNLTWVGYLVCLESLDVVCCGELEEIVIADDDFGGSTRGDEMKKSVLVEDIFKSLKTLKMMLLPKLKSICRNTLAFPCLESIKVFGCPHLKKLPLDSGSNVNNTLREIAGEVKWWSELQWEEDHGNNELVKSKFIPHSYYC